MIMRKAPQLPKSWLIHSVIYEEHEGVDDFSNPILADPVPIHFVRFDESTVFSRDNTQNKIVAEGVLFIDAVNSKYIPKFVEESQITFKDKTYVVKKIITLYQPKSNNVHHYEIEVV